MDSATATVAEAIEDGEARLGEAGCETPRTDAEAIVTAVVGGERRQLPIEADAPLSGSNADTIARYIERRTQREPLAYILGRCEFRGLDLRIDQRVIVPDKASGVLVELANRLPLGSSVHDVGTGSGCVALAIRHERPDLAVTGSDISQAAVAVAQANASRLGLDVAFTVRPWLPEGRYDLVVANFPYLDDQCRTMNLPPEYTRYQPHVAVFAGEDGLGVIRSFVARLDVGALVALQHAPSQTETVRGFFTDPETLGDTEPFARFTIGRIARQADDV